jgi:hypothetical protein
MNAGFSNLQTLKNFLLASSLQTDTAWDSKILPIGLGVAGIANTWCNRVFGYSAAITEVFPGDRPHYYLRQYPLASIAQVNMKYFITDSWTDISGQPIQWNQETGLLSFGYTVGAFPLQIQVIYAGGYFYEQLEPADPGYPTAPPAGIPALPSDVQLAWLVQCAQVWNELDILGTGISANPDQVTNPQKLDLVPMVKQLLQPYRRYQLM